MRHALALSLALFALPALAQDAAPADDAATQAARKALVSYLDAVKAKKWEPARKLTHPRTLEVIADLKRRTKVENHAMAPWARAKESHLTKYEVTTVEESAKGSRVVRTSEEHFSVEDQGVEEGVVAEYLVIPIGGRWYVTDRRLGENQFEADTAEASYRGYFEGEYEPPAPKGGKKK